MPRPRSPERSATLGKLSPPRLGRSFGRERLFAQLDAYAGSPAVWISGPPGAGKTTVVATYLDTRKARCLWIQLDPGDADPATFVYYLGAAVAGAAGRKRVRLPVPDADDLRDAPGFLRRYFRRIAEALPPPWVLVLDNYQEIGETSAVHAGLAQAFAELPAGTRIIAVSRNPPPPAYARAVAAQQIGLVDAHALQFTVEETEQLVSLHGQARSAEALASASDGWAAALILMLATGGEPAQAAFSQGGRARKSLFALFAGEVFDRMTPAQQAVLMRVAFLPSVTETIARVLCDDPDAGAVLADLARRSLFTDRREGREPVYVFHALFGEFLRARAAHAISADELQRLRTQAARLLTDADQVDTAIGLLIDAYAWDDAVRLLDSHAARYVAQGRTTAVRDWIGALPEASRTQPAMRYWLGYCGLAANPSVALGDLEAAYEGLSKAGGTIGALCAAASAADAIVVIGTQLAALDRWIEILAALAPTYFERRDAELDARVLPGMLAAFVYRQPQHALTPRLADLAEGLLDEPGGASQRILLGSLVYFLLWTGQVDRLDRIMAKLDRMRAEQDAAPPTLLRWYGIAILCKTLLGRVDDALADARAALRLVETNDLQPLRVRAHLLIVQSAFAARDAALAKTHLAEASALLNPAVAVDATTYEHARGILALLEGDWASALRMMRAAVDRARDSGWPLREHIALLALTLAATESGAYDEAEAALRAAYAHPFYQVCLWHHWVGGNIEANLADRREQLDRCLDVIRRTFALGREYGYSGGPMLYCCGDMMSRVCAQALEHGIEPQLARDIVRRYALPAPKDARETWPWLIRIRTLGRFQIERDGEPLPIGRKESRKPLDLLRLTLALGGEANVERLAELLWPDAEGDAARNSFDNAMHRLRKLLGGDRYLQLRAGGLGLDAATCWTDLASLDACMAQAAELPEDAGTDAIDAIASRTLALYQGPFLPGEDAFPPVIAARTRLQSRFIRHMSALGSRLEARGQPERATEVYRRVVEQDPLAEEIYRRLIGCLLKLGRRAEAYEAYRRCRDQLSIVLGIRPAAETEALAADLRNL